MLFRIEPQVSGLRRAAHLTCMVTFHLPHIYIFLIENSKKMNIHFLQACQSILQYSRTFQHFWDHARPTKPFGSNSLGPLKFLQRNFLLLLWLWTRSISSVPLLITNLICNFFTVLIPRPIMVVELSQMKHNRHYIFFILEKWTKNMYICGTWNFTICMCTMFLIYMRKTVDPQSGPVKKNSHFFKQNLYNFQWSQVEFFKYLIS